MQRLLPTRDTLMVMRKYGGTLVYHHASDEGVVEVVDDGPYRSLHFGNSAKQSTLDRNHPHEPVLPYVRAMTGALLFQPAPRTALLVGLGGGTLARFLLHRFPDCHVTVVEARAEVVAVAQRYFGLPVEHPQLHIHVGDGFRYLTELAAPTDIYDLILVDAFNHDGMPDSLASLAFFEACARHCHPDGVLAINLWEGQRGLYRRTLKHLRIAFDEPVLLLSVPARSNVVALTPPQQSSQSLDELDERAAALEATHGIEFSRFLHRLRRRHGSVFLRWLP